MNRRFFISTAAAMALSFSLTGTAAAVEKVADPMAFIEALANRAIESLTDANIDRNGRVERFRTLFRDHFAVNGIGKWVLGRYWNSASSDEQTEYLTLFEDLMVVSYVDRFAAYAGESLVVVKSLPNDDTVSTVFSEIRRPGAGQPIRVDWRVSKSDGGHFKIVDVVVEGTSMSTTLRSDFKSIIRQNGGEVAGLLVALRDKTASLKASAATN